MRNEENIDHIVRGKRSITSLSLTYEILTAYQFIIYQVNQEKHMRINFYF